MTRLLSALAAICFLTGGAGEVPDPLPSAGRGADSYLGDPVAIEGGGKLFQRMSCHGCHGGNARGATGPDLTDDQWLRQPTNEMIFNVIKFGRKGTMMSPFKNDMTDEQIWYLVAYIRDLGEKRQAEERAAKK